MLARTVASIGSGARSLNDGNRQIVRESPGQPSDSAKKCVERFRPLRGRGVHKTATYLRVGEGHYTMESLILAQDER